MQNPVKKHLFKITIEYPFPWFRNKTMLRTFAAYLKNEDRASRNVIHIGGPSLRRVFPGAYNPHTQRDTCKM